MKYFFLNKLEIQISEMTVDYKITLKNEKTPSFRLFLWVFWPPQLCLHKKAGHTLHCSKTLRGALQRLHNSAGRTLKALELCGENLQSIFAPRNFGAFEVPNTDSCPTASSVEQTFVHFRKGGPLRSVRKYQNKYVTFIHFWRGGVGVCGATTRTESTPDSTLKKKAKLAVKSKNQTGQAPLITDPPTTSSTTLSNFS